MGKKKVRDTVTRMKEQELSQKAQRNFRFFKNICLGLIILLLIIGSQIATAQVKKWHVSEIQYHINDCPMYLYHAHNAAARKLSTYSIELNLVRGEYGFVQNNRNEVTCADESPFLNELTLPGLEMEEFDLVDENNWTLGTARTWSIKDTKEIVESDIWYNTSLIKEDSFEELIRTPEHEIGHLLGLSHHDSTESLMYRNNDGAPEVHIIDIQDLMERYGHCDYVATDNLLNRYSPRVLVLGEWKWTLERLTELRTWEVVEYGTSDCQ